MVRCGHNYGPQYGPPKIEKEERKDEKERLSKKKEAEERKNKKQLQKAVMFERLFTYYVSRWAVS